MLLTIAITLLTLALTALQFLKQSRTGWNVAKAVCIVLFGLTIWSANEQNQERLLTFERLAAIAFHINWDASLAHVELLNQSEEVSSSDVSVQIKIAKLSEVKLPKRIHSSELEEACVTDERWGYKHLPEEQSELLFRAFERQDGSIVVEDEAKAGVEHIFYTGQSVAATSIGNSRVQMHLDLGPTARSKFASLTDLEDSLLIALVQASSAKRLAPSSLSLILQTSAGRQPLHVPIRLKWSKSASGFNMHTFASKRYVGICIPKGFFSAAQRGT